MAVKERSQIKGTDAQIKAFAGHNGVLAFATDTKSLHVLSGTAGTTTEFLPSSRFATVATSGSYNDLSDKPVVDSALSSTSENPVQNKVVKSALDGKLSTSGGTVSGAVTFNGKITASELIRRAGQKELVIGGADNDGCIHLIPGNDGTFSSKKSASLILTSTDYSGVTITEGGAFRLSAMDATTGAKTLSGSPDGSLTWENQSVAIFQSVSPTSSLWHAKFNQGLILQGNNYHITHWGESTVTLPIAFQTTNYIISATPYLKNASSFTKAPEVCLLSQTTTSFTVYVVSGNVDPSNTFDMYISYACIGY